MTPEDAIKVTQPFYQVDNAITRRRQGAGLGLPLTKLLVELHGGRMEIRSAPGLGTTVSIHLAGVGANRPAMTKRLQTIR
jgi:signal transduction histidine kinase